MSTNSLADLLRDQACIGELALARYRDEAAREICAANRPRLLAIIAEIKPAANAVISETQVEK
jgi:hypothetical protein